jgi:hypothetical protein
VDDDCERSRSPESYLHHVKSKSKSHCDWRSVSQSASLGVEHHLGLMTRYLFLFDSYGLVDVGRSLWREDGSVVLQPSRPSCRPLHLSVAAVVAPRSSSSLVVAPSTLTFPSIFDFFYYWLKCSLPDTLCLGWAPEGIWMGLDTGIAWVSVSGH